MKRKTWYMLISAVVVIAIGITGVSIHMAKQAQNEQTMISELAQLRTAVQMYKSVFHSNPADLSAALTAKYPFAPPQWSMQRNAQGQPMDPFESPYAYDAKSGWIKSTTSGYESW